MDSNLIDLYNQAVKEINEPPRSIKFSNLLQIIPKMPSEYHTDVSKHAWMILSEWDERISDYAYNEYMWALKICLPFLSQEQLTFIWDRALKERQRDDDNDSKLFADISFGLIAPYIAKEEANTKLDDLFTFSSERVYSPKMAVAIAALGNHFPGELQKKAHELAWKIAYRHRSNEDAFKEIIKHLHPDMIMHEWNRTISEYMSEGERSGYEAFQQLNGLAYGIPQEYIKTACTQCAELNNRGSHPERKIEIIKILIKNLPDEEIKECYEYLFSNILKMKKSYYCDFKILAGELILLMPEKIREGKIRQLVEAVRLETDKNT